MTTFFCKLSDKLSAHASSTTGHDRYFIVEVFHPERPFMI
jgi:hypothetical protein